MPSKKRNPAATKRVAKKKPTRDQRTRARESALLRSRAVLLLEQGVNRTRISEQLGVTPATVTRWLKESGIAPVQNAGRPRKLAEKFEVRDIPVDHYAAYGGPVEHNEFAEQFENVANTLLDEDAALVAAERARKAPVEGEEEEPYISQLEARDQEEHDIALVAENQAAPADKYQAFVAATALRIFRDSIPHIRGPRTVKEMSELDQMIRRNLGLNPRGGTAGGGSVRIDISILNNTKADLGGSAIAQRVVDAEVVGDEEDGDDEDY